MSRKLVNLALMVVWLAVAGVILGRDYLPDGLRFWKGDTDTYQTKLGLLALALGVYNFIRWYSARSVEQAPAVEVNALSRDRPDRREEPYTGPNPDFDFLKAGDPERPKGPSANGNHR